MSLFKYFITGWTSLSQEGRLLAFLRDFYFRKSTLFSLACVIFLLVTSYKPSDPFFLIAIAVAVLWLIVNVSMGVQTLALIGARYQIASQSQGNTGSAVADAKPGGREQG